MISTLELRGASMGQFPNSHALIADDSNGTRYP